MLRRLIAAGGIWLALMLSSSPAYAVIQRLTPLKDVIAESQLIFTVRVDAFDAEKPTAVLLVDEALKGKVPFEKLPVNLGTGDAEAKKGEHTEKVLKRLAVKLPLVVFVTKQDKKYIAFAYTTGTWFQMVGEEGEKGTVRWAFTHAEPFLRRTFKGSTDELKQAVSDALADKKKAPEPDAKEKPGFGPEVKVDEAPKEEGERARNGKPVTTSQPPGLRGSQGPLLAVIPSVAIGGAIAVLAALFPAVFGGLMVVLRRWMTLLTVASLNSTLWTVYLWVDKYIYDKWWGTALALWLTMLAITLLGTLWAWRRSLQAAEAGQAVAEAPGRLEQAVLWGTTLIGVALVALFYGKPAWRPEALTGKFLVVLGLGMGTGLLYVLYRKIRKGKQGLPTEGVVLAAMLLTSTSFAATWPRTSAGGITERGETVASASYLGEAWTWTVPGGRVEIDSSPRVDGNHVYLATAHVTAFGGNYGKVYCLDKDTHTLVWTFPEDQSMKEVFSSPCVADGRLYIGEGYHQDPDCKLYCLDAATGKKLWDFPTTSHTESSPTVVDGKVFFGAGDDGIFCLDAATGAVNWHYENEMHIDANPLVVGKRLYVGSGEGDDFKKFEVCCLDTDTGKPIWTSPVGMPAWGAPVLADGQLFVGLGNGNFMLSDPDPKGAFLCLDAATGKEQWRFDGVTDGIHVRPALDRRYVYFAARDNHCYCLDRKGGQVVWKRDLGGPIVSSPVLARCRCHACSTSLYVATSTGLFSCLDPSSGQVQWQLDLSKYSAQILATPAVEVLPAEHGERRRIYLGAGLNLGNTAVLYCLEDRFED
jgi:outer membrane protein assembly factor BamB